MNFPDENYCTVHIMGDFFPGGSVMMLDSDSVNKIRCFICGRKVDRDEIVVMSFTTEDMVCVCKRHLKHRYPPGTFEETPAEKHHRRRP